MNAADPRETAVRLLRATRRSDAHEVDQLGRELAAFDRERLPLALADDRSRVAFWIDLYNATVLSQPRYDFSTWRARARFFSRPLLNVAGQSLSLDDIEHGILRRSRWRLGLGYAGHPWPSDFERTHRVEQIDPRIHFALNCAAASCPPIAAYQTDVLDAQLDLATRSYLDGSIAHSEAGITVPVFFLWFIGDFGGPPGLRRFLKDHGVDGWGRRIRFAAWDWTPTPPDWVSEP
jgi:hypothetical protein